MTGVRYKCKRCLIEKEKQDFKPHNRVCRSCRNEKDYLSFKARYINPKYKAKFREWRKLEYINNPWTIRLGDYLKKHTGKKNYTGQKTETLKLVSIKRIITMQELGVISAAESKAFYNQLKERETDRYSFMLTVKEIFNTPRIKGGLNARS